MANEQQSPHWLEQVTHAILDWQQAENIDQLHVDDMKTPSGRIHTGSLRGVVLHDLVAKALEKSNQAITSTYVFNDMDPMDGLPDYLEQSEYSNHMGKPLYRIPAPELEHSGINLDLVSAEELQELKQAKSMAELYALDFLHTFRRLGCDQEIVWSHELYESGKMDPIIREALDNIDKLKTVYRTVADYELPEKWYPFQVICPNCGKVGTTLVTDWDGTEVSFICQPNKVEWAQGCGNQGRISPFGGTGKLLWKVDWPAHWKVLGVNVEGAGKDHTSAGGSRDMANAQCQQVFSIPIPFDMPYEWILVRGTKMSSSKGVGTSAREFTHLFPPEIGRFLFASRHYNQVIDFDPYAMAVPDLYDEYDLAANIYWQQTEGDQRLATAFAVSQLAAPPDAHFLPRFRDVAVWMQHPELDIEAKFAEVKGSALTADEQQVLQQRIKHAAYWVQASAPTEFQLTPTEMVPEQAAALTDAQRQYLATVGELLLEKTWQPDDLQQSLYELAKSTLGARDGFQAIYLAFLGNKAGPRAAWMLLATDPQLVQTRIKKIAESTQP